MAPRSTRIVCAALAAVALASCAFVAPSAARVAPPARYGMASASSGPEQEGGMQLSASMGIAALAAAAAVLRRASITDKVSFNNIAREWRCKWSADNDKASLDAAQDALDSVISDVKSVEGVSSVQRVVCGGCLDFKVVVKLPADKFGDWESASFAPEEAFLEKLKAIDGISTVETQTYTLEEV